MISFLETATPEPWEYRLWSLSARLQFSLAVGIHFIFAPLTIGLPRILLILETLVWKTEQEVRTRITIVFARILGLTIAAALLAPS